MNKERIVAKVDELMALCDALEREQESSIAAHEVLVENLLAALTNAADKGEFKQAWARVAEHFDTLFTTERSVDQLKQTILQLAVMGKLVEQDPTDEPAGGLLKRIAAEKARLVKEKKIKKQKALPEIGEEDKSFDLPDNWSWSRMGQLCHTVADGPHFSPKYVDEKSGVLFLSGRNIRVENIDFTTAKYVSKEDHDKFCERVKVKKGDVLYTKGGTTGIAKVNDTDVEFSVWVHVAVLQIPNDKIYNEYMSLALNSPHCYKQSQELTHGIGNKDLGLTRMIKITMPIPPLQEQYRIVAKVNELKVFCDQLSSRISESQVVESHMASTLVEKVLM